MAVIEGWMEEIERKVLTCLQGGRVMTPTEIAEKLRTSESEVVFYITLLARDGKIDITGVKACSQGNAHKGRFIQKEGGSS